MKTNIQDDLVTLYLTPARLQALGLPREAAALRRIIFALATGPLDGPVFTKPYDPIPFRVEKRPTLWARLRWWSHDARP